MTTPTPRPVVTVTRLALAELTLATQEAITELLLNGQAPPADLAAALAEAKAALREDVPSREALLARLGEWRN